MDSAEKIIIYRTPDGETSIDVKLENDTVWLTQAQMTELFQKDQSVIARHISNVFKEGELPEKSNMQILHNTLSKYKPTKIYSLDVVISVGYRVKSRRGTLFRIWANKILKDYLVKGFVINQKVAVQRYEELKKIIQIVGRTAEGQKTLGERKDDDSLLGMIVDYAYALDTLDKYDFQRLETPISRTKEKFHATYDNAKQAINALKSKFGGSVLFGNEKDQSFKSSIGQIYQTFNGRELYPSVEEKAAMLLYLVVKNHSFSDGNKRIAAMIFLWFLGNNGALYCADGRKRIADATLVATTLMIAESRPEEREMMVKVVVNLINKEVLQ